MIQEFQDIRPYYDDEIEVAMAKIVADPLFEKIKNYLYPTADSQKIKKLFLSNKSIDQFQTNVMHQAVRQILQISQSSFTIEGLENLEKDKSYIFVSNHRDIMLDSAILQVALKENDFRTTEITFGSNLMRPEIVINIGKSNKMFKVIRASNTREFLIQSQHLSDYIRHTITEKKESVWIAQRNGRTKDGNDITEQGLIKMFSLSGDIQKAIVERLMDLNIVPIVISYQYEPCDALKVQELYTSIRQKYKKTPNEDINSILTGIRQVKGKIVIRICKPLNSALSKIKDLSNKEIFSKVAEIIDTEIHSSYHLFDTNYIAWDMLHNCERFLDIEYTKESRNEFADRMYALIDTLSGDQLELISRFLRIYAYPLKNQLKI
ncbi:MAG: 1-acyl-sn-glycerol-3-phosphate acyltransferase [Bacteroidales bacterium]